MALSLEQCEEAVKYSKTDVKTRWRYLLYVCTIRRMHVYAYSCYNLLKGDLKKVWADNIVEILGILYIPSSSQKLVVVIAQGCQTSGFRATTDCLREYHVVMVNVTP